MLLNQWYAIEHCPNGWNLEVGKLLTASWLYRYWNETHNVAYILHDCCGGVDACNPVLVYLDIPVKFLPDQAGDIGDAVAVVERIDAQIDREENKIALIEDRILGIGGSVDIVCP